MLFGKNTHLVGLDIGSRTIKVGELLDTKKGYSLKKFGMVDIEPGLIEEGMVQDLDVVADSIRELFKTHSIKEQNVAISIGGYSVIVKKINVQTMTEEELQDAIHYEAEQYIPFDIADVNLDFQILGEAESSTNQMSVMLVAAKKEMIDDYIHLVQLAGLNPCIIDVDAFALQNVYEVNYDNLDDNIALIDIGASKTSLNILKGGDSVFMRDVSLGCGQINEKIASTVECSFEEAETLKFGDKEDKLSSHELREAILSVTTDWSSEIKRALDYFYSTDSDSQINRIVLSGGGAHIEEFRHLLADETSCEVETINPFSGLNIDLKQFDASYHDEIAPRAAICLGLSLRRVDDK